MNKVASALGWFALGSFCAALFIYASMNVQPASSSALLIDNEEFIPKVPSLSHTQFESSEIINAVVQLDGLECRKCKFANVTFEYSGGAYKLDQAAWKRGTIKMVFKGAAVNTLQTLALAEAMTSQSPPNALPPKPKQKEFQIKYDMTNDWATQ